MPKKISKRKPIANTKNNNIDAQKKITKGKMPLNSKKHKQQQQQEISDSQNKENEQRQNNSNEQSEQLISLQNQGSQNGDSGDSGDQSQDDQSSVSSLAPQNYAIKQMQFRERRGTKMNYLMNRKKEQQQDSFWQKQGQDYFGGPQNQNQEDDQSYQQSSSGRDQFDSDFNQTQSQHSNNQQKKQEIQEVDQNKIKQKKRQEELMKKIGAPVAKKKIAKTNTSRNESDKKQVPEIITNRYIHQACTQQQLLGQAAHTEYINWISLQKLISLESDRKDFAKKSHHLEGSKLIYKDKINQSGERNVSIQLVRVQAPKISDLTELWLKQNER